jgi:hypothetical protein
VREGKLLKQQNQALTLYKAHQQDIYAQWAVESMYLISLNLKFETKVLDIAYLLMLKLMKEPHFKFDKKFVMLQLKVLEKQGKYKDALSFIERRQEFFNDKVQRQKLEINLYLLFKNHILAINVFFNMLRLNSHVNNYQEMWPIYQECIRVIIDDYLPRQKSFQLNTNFEMNLLNNEMQGVNFDPVKIDDSPSDLLMNLVASIKNLRKNIVVDTSSSRVIKLANAMRRTSYLADIEYKFVLGLRYHHYLMGEKSLYMSLMKEYIDKFYDTFDVVEDLKPYFRTFGINEAAFLRGFVRSKLEEVEKDYDQDGDSPPSADIIKWRLIFFKINKILGAFVSMSDDEKLKVVYTIMQTYLWAQQKQEVQANEKADNVETVGDEITDVDRANLDDIILVAIEILHGIKKYEQSVLNPINFMKVCILEYALKKSPNNNSLRIWMMKTCDKLGLTTKLTNYSSSVKGLNDADFEKFGAMKFAHYQDFGFAKELELTSQRYEKYY